MHIFGYEPQPGEKAPFGPPVLLVAGMRAEEVPRVRELLDELGGHSVKLLAVSPSSLVWPSLYATARLTLYNPPPHTGGPRHAGPAPA